MSVTSWCLLPFASDRSRIKARWRLLRCAPMIALGLAACGATGRADTTATLTGLGTTNDDVPLNHGSNGEVTVIWSPEWDQYAEWDGRGDVYQVDQPITTLKLAPTAGNVQVRLDQFELDEYAGGGDTSARWSVTGATSGLLASGTWETFNTANDPNDLGGRSLVAVGAAGAAGEALTLSIDHTGTGSVSYLAMDNLVFSSVLVPEPTSATLFAAATGLGAAAMRNRRRPDR